MSSKKPSKRMMAWLKANGFRLRVGPPDYQWARDIPGIGGINKALLTVSFHQSYHADDIGPSWRITADVHSDKFMAHQEDDVIAELEKALVWMDTEHLVPWPDEERSIHRDGAEAQAAELERWKLGGYGAGPRKFTPPHVEFTYWIEPEEIGVVGNVMASGDPALDREQEQWVFDQLERGNEAAWCHVVVECEIEFEGFRDGGVRGVDSLGAVSYESERQLWKDLLPEMKANALDGALDMFRKYAPSDEARVALDWLLEHKEELLK